MTDFEPYVADPAEPPPTPRLQRLRLLVVVLAVGVLVGAVVGPAIRDREAQDPSLDVPLEGTPPADGDAGAIPDLSPAPVTTPVP